MFVTSMFVNNIPNQVHWRWLWNIFSNHGDVVDVFIPKKRSKSGRRYGFVRFSNHPDALKVINRLNGVWLLNSRIGVNFARFKGRTSYWRKVPKSPSAKPTTKCDTIILSPGSDTSPGISNAVVDDPGKKSYLQALLNNHSPFNVRSPPRHQRPSLIFQKTLSPVLLLLMRKIFIPLKTASLVLQGISMKQTLS
ncbi:hypothetical protein REPUB_Repub11eG0016200 [Reevesia pubescens]